MTMFLEILAVRRHAWILRTDVPKVNLAKLKSSKDLSTTPFILLMILRKCLLPLLFLFVPLVARWPRLDIPFQGFLSQFVTASNPTIFLVRYTLIIYTMGNHLDSSFHFQVCYKMDVNSFTKNIDKKDITQIGLKFVLDYNEDRWGSLFPRRMENSFTELDVLSKDNKNVIEGEFDAQIYFQNIYLIIFRTLDICWSRKLLYDQCQGILCNRRFSEPWRDSHKVSK